MGLCQGRGTNMEAAWVLSTLLADPVGLAAQTGLRAVPPTCGGSRACHWIYRTTAPLCPSGHLKPELSRVPSFLHRGPWGQAAGQMLCICLETTHGTVFAACWSCTLRACVCPEARGCCSTPMFVLTTELLLYKSGHFPCSSGCRGTLRQSIAPASPSVCPMDHSSSSCSRPQGAPLLFLTSSCTLTLLPSVLPFLPSTLHACTLALSFSFTASPHLLP